MKRLIKLSLLIIFIVVPTTANGQQFNSVTDIAWNADGTLIAISYFNGSIEVWSVSTSTLVWSTITSGTTYLDWNPTNPTEFAFEQLDGPVTIVDVTTNVVGLQIPVQGYVNSIAYDPTGSRLLISHVTGEIGPGAEGYIRVFERANGQDIISYERIGNDIRSAKWDNTGARILALSDGMLIIWDATSGQIIQTFSELETSIDEDGNTWAGGQMIAFDINPVNNDLAISEPIFISFWDAPIYSVKRLESLVFSSVDLEWSVDGRFIATAGGTNRVVKIIDPATGEVLNTINTSSNVEVIAWNPVTSELAIGEITATGEISVIANPTNSCGTTIPSGDSLGLVNSITSANSLGTPQTLCLEAGTYTLDAPITSAITLVGLGAGAEIIGTLQVSGAGRLTLRNVSVNR
jgi:hypothetical protein